MTAGHNNKQVKQPIFFLQLLPVEGSLSEWQLCRLQPSFKYHGRYLSESTRQPQNAYSRWEYFELTRRERSGLEKKSKFTIFWKYYVYERVRIYIGQNELSRSHIRANSLLSHLFKRRFIYRPNQLSSSCEENPERISRNVCTWVKWVAFLTEKLNCNKEIHLNFLLMKFKNVL